MAADLLAQDNLPRWDLTTIFPSLDSPEFASAFEAWKQQIAALVTLFDELDVRQREPAAAAQEAALFESVISRLNEVFEAGRTLGSYVGCLVSTDAANAAAQARMSEMRVVRVPLDQLWTRFTGWLGSVPLESFLAASEVAREYDWPIRRAQVQARHQMTEAEEALAAELQPVGLSGWARLHSDLTALLTVPVPLRGEVRTLAMSAVRALANEPDREVRRAAYEAEIKAWEGVEVPLAAALNGVKGYQSKLNQRRGWPDDVEPTLLQNSIDRATLEAMQQACVESFPDFRRYMHAKAHALGLERLAWYDMNAPVGGAARSYSWEEAEAFLIEQFGRYSERMASFAERSFRERWIDVGPRPGKEGGAYCTCVRPGESRVLMNFDGSYNNVSTLAHELGHAYHNLNLEPRRILQGRTPSTLAETASIFCETLALEAALETAPPDEGVTLLESSLQRDLMVVVDIHSRFLFEKAVFEQRAPRELAPREFSELMLAAQQQTYGEDLDEEQLHRYMWAVKGHYYGPMFYNYPYTFGLLFGLGLYGKYQEDPAGFRSGYDDLLSSTGLADAAALAARFGIDVRSVGFWRSSLDVIRRNIERFENLV